MIRLLLDRAQVYTLRAILINLLRVIDGEVLALPEEQRALKCPRRERI